MAEYNGHVSGVINDARGRIGNVLLFDNANDPGSALRDAIEAEDIANGWAGPSVTASRDFRLKDYFLILGPDSVSISHSVDRSMLYSMPADTKRSYQRVRDLLRHGVPTHRVMPHATNNSSSASSDAQSKVNCSYLVGEILECLPYETQQEVTQAFGTVPGQPSTEDFKYGSILFGFEGMRAPSFDQFEAHLRRRASEIEAQFPVPDGKCQFIFDCESFDDNENRVTEWRSLILPATGGFTGIKRVVFGHFRDKSSYYAKTSTGSEIECLVYEPVLVFGDEGAAAFHDQPGYTTFSFSGNSTRWYGPWYYTDNMRTPVDENVLLQGQTLPIDPFGSNATITPGGYRQLGFRALTVKTVMGLPTEAEIFFRGDYTVSGSMNDGTFKIDLGLGKISFCYPGSHLVDLNARSDSLPTDYLNDVQQVSDRPTAAEIDFLNNSDVHSTYFGQLLHVGSDPLAETVIMQRTGSHEEREQIRDSIMVEEDTTRGIEQKTFRQANADAVKHKSYAFFHHLTSRYVFIERPWVLRYYYPDPGYPYLSFVRCDSELGYRVETWRLDTVDGMENCKRLMKLAIRNRFTIIGHTTSETRLNTIKGLIAEAAEVDGFSNLPMAEFEDDPGAAWNETSPFIHYGHPQNWPNEVMKAQYLLQTVSRKDIFSRLMVGMAGYSRMTISRVRRVADALAPGPLTPVV